MKLTSAEEKRINSLLKKTSKPAYLKRLQIVLFRSKGKSYKEITDLLNCNPSTVTRTLTKYKEGGLEALLKETRGGRNRSYLTFEEEKDFLAKELKKASKGEHVTIGELYRAYQERVGKSTTRVGFYYLLSRHGWRKVTPRPEHPKKADAQTIVASKNKIYIQETKKAL